MAVSLISTINTIRIKLNSCVGNLTAYNSATDYLNTAILCVSSQQASQNIPLYLRQGRINKTTSYSDLAIKGKGYFMVNDTYNNNVTLLAREGSFTTDYNGYLVNAGGYQLQGYNLNGKLGPIDLVHITPILYNQATANVNIRANLQASQIADFGSGDLILFPYGATNNYGISAATIIVNDTSGGNSIKAGDYINITSLTTNQVHQFIYGGYYYSNNIQNNLLGAATINELFSLATDGWEFQLTSQNYPTVNFYYLTSSPNITLGQFNNLATLSQAINSAYGFMARIVSPYLYFGPIDATQNWNITDITGSFTNILFNGTGSPSQVTISGTSQSFSSLNGLANLINACSDIGAVINNKYSSSSLSFYVLSSSAKLKIAASSTNMLNELGLESTNPYTIGPSYDMTGATANNMASGKVSPHYSFNMLIYDSIGINHNLTISFLKSSTSTWSAEYYIKPSTDIVGRSDGQVASGYISFNGDGTLNSYSPSIAAVSITWSNGAITSNINFFLGTEANYPNGKMDGLMQLDSPYILFSDNQDGLPVGKVNSFYIDINGNVNVTYSNNATTNLYTIPLAYPANTRGLTSYDLGVYQYKNALAGGLNISSANDGFMGQIESFALELYN